MTKKAVLFFLFFSLLFSSYSQILEPISWEFKVDSSNYSDSKKLDLIFEPTTELGWYIYSSDNDPEAGPYTMFDFDENATYSLDENIKVKNVKTNEIDEIKLDGVFIAIGHDPATQLFKDQLNMDKEGYLITKPDSTETNIPGVYAAGDVKDKTFRQAVTAAGMGCMAALEAEKFLSH